MRAGTAVVMCPVGSLTYDGKRTVFGEEGQTGPVCQQLYDALTELQTEQREDADGWVVPLDDFDAVIDAAPAE